MRCRVLAVRRLHAPSIAPLLLVALALCAGCRDGVTGTFEDAETPAEDAAAGADDAAQIADDASSGPRDAGLGELDALSAAEDARVGRDALAAPDRDAPTDAGGNASDEPRAGDLVIVEVQGNPQQVDDAVAEYIEVLNVSGRPLDLAGVRITHVQWPASGTAPVRSTGNHRVRDPVMVAPGARALLTRGGGGHFGGATRDYVYAGFELSNSDPNRLRLMVPGWDGSEPPNVDDVIDELMIPAETFDNDRRGRSWQLDPDEVAAPTATTNDDPADWCHTGSGAAGYWMNNWGTPGAANDCL